MAAGAPRLLSRLWHRCARGACLVSGLCLALPGVAAAAEITAARFGDPTARYDHAILGDALEWGALELTLADGRKLRAVLPETLVFEDTKPRLWDVDGDGEPEVVVIETAPGLGARLAIWDETGRLAATPHIGRTHRWLAPVGAADLDGDGRIEMAYVDRPHLAKVLRLWRFEAGQMVAVTDLPGLTNHRIGWDFIPGGVRSCKDVPEMVLANADWSRVMAVRFDGQVLSARDIGRYDSPASLDAALACN